MEFDKSTFHPLYKVSSSTGLSRQHALGVRRRVESTPVNQREKLIAEQSFLCTKAPSLELIEKMSYFIDDTDKFVRKLTYSCQYLARKLMHNNRVAIEQQN